MGSWQPPIRRLLWREELGEAFPGPGVPMGAFREHLGRGDGIVGEPRVAAAEEGVTGLISPGNVPPRGAEHVWGLGSQTLPLSLKS